MTIRATQPISSRFGTYMPGQEIGEAAAVGVPDEMMGEKVGAVIVPAPGGKLDVEAIVSHCRRSLADFKVPQYLALREEPLPRNPAGKVLKAQLREETEWGKPLR